MKKLFFCFLFSNFILLACNYQNKFRKIIPYKVNEFANEYIYLLQNGNIDSCLSLVSLEKRNEELKQYLTNAYKNIFNFDLDSFKIVAAKKSIKYKEKGAIYYNIIYEYCLKDIFIYFTFIIKNQDDKFFITEFDGRIFNVSLSKINSFSLKNKNFIQYLFLFLSIFIPIFTIITLIFIIKSKLNKKYLWIVGTLFGLMKFSIDWTYGEISINIFSLYFLSSEISRLGEIYPWIISISFPLVAIIFWYKKILKNN